MQRIFLFFLIALSVLTSAAQDYSQYKKEWFIQNGDTLPCRVLLPVDYNPARRYPVIFFLHGRGESGSDNEKQLTHGAKLFLTDSLRKKYPAIVIFPQCAADNYWANAGMVATGEKSGKRSFYFTPAGEPTDAMKALTALVDNVLIRYPVDRMQVYVMGLSMGGMGTYELVRRKPGVFAAAIAICGGAHPTTAKGMKGTAWWLFHGQKDDVVSPQFTIDMASALRKAGATVQLTLYPQANHNSWDSAFAEQDLLKWLFSKRKQKQQ